MYVLLHSLERRYKQVKPSISQDRNVLGNYRLGCMKLPFGALVLVWTSFMIEYPLLSIVYHDLLLWYPLTAFH